MYSTHQVRETSMKITQKQWLRTAAYTKSSTKTNTFVEKRPDKGKQFQASKGYNWGKVNTWEETRVESVCRILWYLPRVGKSLSQVKGGCIQPVFMQKGGRVKSGFPTLLNCLQLIIIYFGVTCSGFLHPQKVRKRTLALHC